MEGVTFQPHGARQHGGGAGGCRRAGAGRDRTSSWRCARTGRRSGNPTFVYVPRAANVLRERERHIANCWKASWRPKTSGWRRRSWISPNSTASTRSCWRMFREQKEELETSNRWADELNARIAARGGAHRGTAGGAGARAGERAAGGGRLRTPRLPALEQESREKTQWALDAERRDRWISRARRDWRRRWRSAPDRKELEERTAWALRLEDEAATVRRADSPWCAPRDG